MIVVCETTAAECHIERVQEKIRKLGLKVHRSDGAEHTVLGIVGDRRLVNKQEFQMMPGVRKLVEVSEPYKLASRDFHPADSTVYVGDVPVGGREVILVAGPCAVESEDQIEAAAAAVSRCGARILRGGAFKPRTSPYSFQGLGEKGLEMMRTAANRHDLAVVTEVMSPEQIPLISQYADLLQVGARNMQNYTLLKAVGEADKPVLLKRGQAATIKDWLMSSEYILDAGNPNVILCERGIRTFETATRNTLDLSAVPVIKQLSHLPVIVDPSHGVGISRFVPPLARAAVAVGADGLMVEAHPSPAEALSDGMQSLDFDELALLANRIRIIATTIGRGITRGNLP